MATTEKPQSRIAFLRDRVKAASKRTDRTTFAVPFRQKQLNLVVIEVPIDFPLYNVRSGRTHRAHSQYIDQHGLPEDFFIDPEDSHVQGAQHQILLDMVDERGLAKDLLDKSQKDPIVLTYDGFIIDGNRRVAALKREGDVEYVTAIVLPEDATDAEIYETEVELQMAAETKAPYNWIDEGLHIKYGVERLYEKKRPEDALHTVAQRMAMSDEEVKFILDRLSVVDLYLEWLEQPGKYHLIPTERGGAAEQAFRELADRMRQQQFQRMPQRQLRAIREACFAAIASGGGYKDVRRIADSMRKQPAEFMERLRPALPADLGKALDEPEEREEPLEPADEPDLLGELARAEGDGGSETPATALLKVLGTPEAGKRSGEAIIQTAVELDEEQKERKQEPDVQIGRALSILKGLDVTGQARHLDEIARLLHELLETAERLASRVEDLRGEEE
jgi:hypothetical protein